MLRPILMFFALTASSLASGQSLEPPERIARLSYVQGEMSFQGAQEVAPSALPDRPLDRGDRLSTARDGRAEIALGGATLRLDEDTALTIADLDASTVRLQLDSGTASVHLHDLLDDETFEVVTLNTTVAFREPGEYRVDITPSGATEIAVRAGDAEVATAGGPVRVADGQRVRLEGRAEVATLVTPRAADDFDEWVMDREVQLAESAPPRSESADIYDNETLDQYGEWRDDPGYGQVWMPSYAYGGYDPFAYGYWQRSGFGYSWYDPMPWSSYTFHNGYWTYLEDRNRWAWVAQRRDLRQRAARTDHQLDHALDGPRTDRGSTHPVGRPNAGEAQRRAEATSSGLGRRIDADRQPVLQRTVDQLKSQRNASTPQASAPAPRSAPASQGSSTPAIRPARPATTSSSSNSNSSAASRATATSNAAKGALSRPQDP